MNASADHGRIVRVRFDSLVKLPTGRHILSARSPSLYPLELVRMNGSEDASRFALLGFFVSGQPAALRGEMRKINAPEPDGTDCSGAPIWIPGSDLELHVGHGVILQRYRFDCVVTCREIMTPLDVFERESMPTFAKSGVEYDAPVRVR